MGLLLALSVVLNLAEGMLPALPAMPPGVRLGLSNMVTLYCVFFLGWREALTIACLKSGFVLLTRGAAAGFISFSGGLLSVLVMLLTARTDKLSILFKSVLGALAHNLGQLLVAAFIVSNIKVFVYFPVLLFTGMICGTVIGCLSYLILRKLPDRSIS